MPTEGAGTITAKDIADTSVSVKPKKQVLEDDEERLGITADQQTLLLTLAEKAEKEDQSVREMLLRGAKGNHDYFRGFQNTFWSEVAHDWTIPNAKDLEAIDADDESLNRYINIVRAHGESLIAALGTNPPSSKYFPDDADVEADISTAKAYNKLEKLINKHNDGPLLFFKSLFLLYNEGIIFGHNYIHQHESYGKATGKKVVKGQLSSQALTCPKCGASDLEQTPLAAQQEQTEETTEENPLQEGSGGEEENKPEGISSEQEGEQDQTQEPQDTNDETGPLEPPQETEAGSLQQQKQTSPDNNLQSGQGELPNSSGTTKMCPTCNVPYEPEGEPVLEETETETEVDVNKSRSCIDIYGLLNIKFPIHARKQEHGGYLRLAFEEDEALTKHRFPDVFDRITGSGGASSSNTYERWARTDSNYLGQVTPELVTVRVYWFRPWFFNRLGNPQDESQTELADLIAKYPKGCKLTIINNNIIAEAPVEENLDEHWNIVVDPLCNTLHSDPIVKPIIPLQDVKNEVFDLSVSTIEQGISETFVDSTVLDFSKYKKERAQPGMKYPVKAAQGKSISDAFYQDKPATLHDEVEAFNKSVDQEAQFVLGSFPSIWGGIQHGGSKTLGEYQTSRSQALQRLGIVWQKVSRFFNGLYKIAVPALAKAIADGKYDERSVEQKGTSFINVWIRQSELTGKVGNIEPEASEKLPVTWAQRRELWLQLIQMQNPLVESVLTHPQNAPQVRDALGLDDIYIPGEDDRDKQYAEFVILLESGPAGQDEQGIPQTSLPVNPWDDHKIEAATCRSFINSPTGLAFKQENQEGFMNIVAHMAAHEKALQAQTANQLPHSPSGQEPESNATSRVE